MSQRMTHRRWRSLLGALLCVQVRQLWRDVTMMDGHHRASWRHGCAAGIIDRGAYVYVLRISKSKTGISGQLCRRID